MGKYHRMADIPLFGSSDEVFVKLLFVVHVHLWLVSLVVWRKL